MLESRRARRRWKVVQAAVISFARHRQNIARYRRDSQNIARYRSDSYSSTSDKRFGANTRPPAIQRATSLPIPRPSRERGGGGRLRRKSSKRRGSSDEDRLLKKLDLTEELKVLRTELMRKKGQ